MSRKLAQYRGFVIILFLGAALLLSLSAPGPCRSGQIKTTQKIIVIDPGHGGADAGLASPTGAREKDIALALARKTASLLETRYNTFLTRAEDKNLTAVTRAETANRLGADFYLSIHLHHQAKKPDQPFIYYYTRPGKEPVPPENREWDTVALAHQAESRKAAATFETGWESSGGNQRPFITGAPVILLKGLSMPAILVEPFSLTRLPARPADQQVYIDRIARQLAGAVVRYLSQTGS